jgi:hypothetical protein
LNVIDSCERNRSRFVRRRQSFVDTLSSLRSAFGGLLFSRRRHQAIQPEIHRGHAVVVSPTAW